jgi:hypothetical protein
MERNHKNKVLIAEHPGKPEIRQRGGCLELPFPSAGLVIS